jgi:hypothetical protein
MDDNGNEVPYAAAAGSDGNSGGSEAPYAAPARGGKGGDKTSGKGSDNDGGGKNSGNASDQKKQIPLRVSAKLFAELAAWAADDFRSINGQIEYLLTECVKQRGRGT